MGSARLTISPRSSLLTAPLPYRRYLADEPDGQYIPVADVAAAAAVIRSIDDRPIAMVHFPRTCPGRPLSTARSFPHACPQVLSRTTHKKGPELGYAQAADIIMADPYPIGSCSGGLGPGKAGGCDNVSMVIDATESAVRATSGQRRPPPRAASHSACRVTRRRRAGRSYLT